MKQQRLTFKTATRNNDQLRINCLAAFNFFKTTGREISKRRYQSTWTLSFTAFKISAHFKLRLTWIIRTAHLLLYTRIFSTSCIFRSLVTVFSVRFKLHSSNYSPHVMQARYLWQIFNRRSVSRNTTQDRQSLNLQAMLTGETLKS